jgi:hypothetical protein
LGTLVTSGCGVIHFNKDGIPIPSSPSAPATVWHGHSSKDPIAREVMHDIDAPATKANIMSFEAWARHEGTKAKNNPLATERDMPGATNFNKAGVKNYLTMAEGAEATARSLKSGYYRRLLKLFKRGKGVCGKQSEFHTWTGSPKSYGQVC